MTKKTFREGAPISAYITNLGKYNEGQLIGQWISFPVSEEEIKKCLDNIGINEYYEEYFVTDYNININGITSRDFEKYMSIDTLNEMAEAFEFIIRRSGKSGRNSRGLLC